MQGIIVTAARNCLVEIAGGKLFTHFVTSMMLDRLVASVHQAAACTIGTLPPAQDMV